MIDFGSVWRGTLEMKFPHGKVNYAIRTHQYRSPRIEAWTPIFHEGRGIYISICFVFVSFYRGY